MSTLFLKLAPRAPGQIVVNARLKVQYRLDADARVDMGPRSVDHGLGQWTTRMCSGSYQNTNQFFNDCQELRVVGKALPEFMSFRGTSYWQFLPSYIWPEFFAATQLIECLVPIFDETRPYKVALFRADESLHPIWHGVARVIAARYSAHIEICGPRNPFRASIKGLLKRKGVAHVVRHVRRSCRALPFALSDAKACRNATRAQASGLTAIFMTVGARHWVRRPEGPETERHDEQFYPLVPAFASAGWSRIAFIDIEDLPRRQLEQRNVAAAPSIGWRQFSSYANANPLIDLFAMRHFAVLWRLLREDPEFADGFRYMGVPLMPALTHVLEHAFRDLALECNDFLKLAARALQVERPAAVVLTYETGPWERAFIIEACARGIPTVGLQHGMIFETHYDYTHRRKTTNPRVVPGVFCVPSVTCVWGEAYKDTLIVHGHYADESVAVTGHWRYDFLAQASDAGAAGDRAGNSKNSSVRPSATVGVCPAGDDIATAFKHCCEAVRGIAGASMRVRLHPSDHVGTVSGALAEYGLSESIIQRGHLFDLLRSCDVIVAQYSTLISEAALADKPIVLLDLDKKSVATAYVDSGICIVVTEAADLRQAIERALYDEQLRQQLSSARREFVARFFLRVDGGAARRVLGVVERLCRLEEIR